MTNTNGKVTVSREVAESLATITREFDRETIIYRFTRRAMLAYPEITDLPLDMLIRALYVGYEVERSPEEELADFIQSDRFNACTDPFGKDHDYYVGRIAGARKAAEILGVKLPEPTEGADVN